jgi:hypothetical protein
MGKCENKKEIEYFTVLKMPTITSGNNKEIATVFRAAADWIEVIKNARVQVAFEIQVSKDSDC